MSTSPSTLQRPSLAATIADSAPAVAAATAAGCLVLHVVFLVAGGRDLWSLSVPMLALSLACAGCATHAWARRSGAQAALRAMVACGAAMVAAHLVIDHAHIGMSAGTHESMTIDLLMHAAVTLAASQAVVALIGIVCASRSRHA